MDNGLGRTGYLLLTTVMFLLGGMGLATAYLAQLDGSHRFFSLGLGLAGIALLAMFGFAAWAPWLAAPPAMKPVKKPKQMAPEAKAIDYEFKDPEPATKTAPESLVVPPAFSDGGVAFNERDPAAWPERRPSKSSWTARVEQEQKVQSMVEESAKRRELTKKYTADAPTVRAVLEEPQLVVAQRAPADMPPGATAPGMTLGRCGRCKTPVMAPTARPIRLKCPECAKVTLLN